MGVGRFLEWVVVEDRGQAQGILVLWDNRVLELIDMEGGHFQSLIDSKTETKVSFECFQGCVGQSYMG